ncbi:MAG: class I SAM-dependent methyltransferase family protein [Nitrososphaeria archaeon]
MTKLLRRILRGVLRDDELEMVAGGFDVIGDVAIIRVRPELPREARVVAAEALMRAVPSIRSVWAQVTPVSGEYRLRGLEHLAGEERTLTLYRENGCSYLVDVAKVYFSPRLSGERLRVASLVRDGEVVHNMFAGVGPFSILIARMAKGVRVYSSEINPDAYELLERNVRLNRVEGSVIPMLGDALEHARRLRDLGIRANRVLLPLPERALDALPVATEELRVLGVAHIYLHVEGGSPERRAMEEVSSRVPELHPYYARTVREVAPRLYQVVVDAVYLPSASARPSPGGRPP